jgi:hypothetical protein
LGLVIALVSEAWRMGDNNLNLHSTCLSFVINTVNFTYNPVEIAD